MSSPFALIGTAWRFYRKQPVLNEIAFWFFFLPIATFDTVISLMNPELLLKEVPDAANFGAEEVLLLIPLVVVLIYLLFWGQACVLAVTKRMVSSPAGRNRSSFKAVRKEGRKFIAALFLTDLLRGLLTLLWMLLFIIPGILYSIRTMFFGIMLVERGKIVYGRQMLNKSADLVRGHTWDIFWRVVAIALCIFIPIALIEGAIVLSLVAIDERLITLGIVLADFIESFATVFFITSIIALYADLKHGTA